MTLWGMFLVSLIVAGVCGAEHPFWTAATITLALYFARRTADGFREAAKKSAQRGEW